MVDNSVAKMLERSTMTNEEYLSDPMNNRKYHVKIETLIEEGTPKAQQNSFEEWKQTQLKLIDEVIIHNAKRRMELALRHNLTEYFFHAPSMPADPNDVRKQTVGKVGLADLPHLNLEIVRTPPSRVSLVTSIPELSPHPLYITRGRSSPVEYFSPTDDVAFKFRGLKDQFTEIDRQRLVEMASIEISRSVNEKLEGVRTELESATERDIRKLSKHIDLSRGLVRKFIVSVGSPNELTFHEYHMGTNYTHSRELFDRKMLSILWGGLSQSPDYWTKREDEARQSNRRNVHDVLGSGLSLPRTWNPTATKPLRNIRYTESKDHSVTSRSEFKQMKQTPLFEVSNPLPRDLIMAPLEHASRSEPVDISSNTSKGSGTHVSLKLPAVATNKFVPVASPDRAELASIEVTALDGRTLQLGVDYEIRKVPQGGEYFIKLLQDTSPTVVYEASFHPHKTPSRQNLPTELQVLDSARLKTVAGELQMTGMTAIATALLRRIQQRKPISIFDLADIVAKQSSYTYETVQLPFPAGGTRFSGYQRYLNPSNGRLCLQCDGANNFLRDLLNAVLPENHPFEIRNEIVYSLNGRRKINANQTHMRTIILGPSELHITLDGTPSSSLLSTEPIRSAISGVWDSFSRALARFGTIESTSKGSEKIEEQEQKTEKTYHDKLPTVSETQLEAKSPEQVKQEQREKRAESLKKKKQAVVNLAFSKRHKGKNRQPLVPKKPDRAEPLSRAFALSTAVTSHLMGESLEEIRTRLEPHYRNDAKNIRTEADLVEFIQQQIHAIRGRIETANRPQRDKRTEAPYYRNPALKVELEGLLSETENQARFMGENMTTVDCKKLMGRL